jgi:ubiquinone/menaquinone biosynthesis C-methylase UbiE
MSFSAQAYERSIVPSLFAPWAAYLVQAADVRPGERVLDVACGTGIVARYVAPRVGSQGHVIGLDINPAVISVARAAAEREGLSIEWQTGPAEQLPFPDGAFDLILCQFGLMFFTDRHQALQEMRRVLAPGGRIVVSVWQGLDQHPFYQILDEVTRRQLGKSSVQAVFALGDAGELRHLLTNAGFQQVVIESASLTARFSNPAEFLAWEINVDAADTPALQGLDDEAQQAILAAVRQELQAPLQAVMQEGQMVLDYHAHIAHARR